MAQGLLEDMVRGRYDIQVGSAGVGAIPGHLACEHSIDVMAELGIDIRHYRSRPLTQDLVRKADFIFAMTYHHLDSILMIYPQAAEKTFLLREFEPNTPISEREISDPIGQSLSVYRKCRDQIKAALGRVLEEVIRRSPGSNLTLAPVDKAAVREALEVATEQKPRTTGNRISVMEQVQAFGYSRKTGEIYLTNVPSPARINLLDGDVVDAQYGNLQGVGAAIALMLLKDTETEFVLGELPSRRTIEISIKDLLLEVERTRKFIERQQMVSPRKSGNGGRVTQKTISISADASGADLKEEICDWLTSNGFSIKDHTTLGTSMGAGINRVAHEVNKGEAESGILIDGTGIGLCMAANKLPGIRAALVFSGEMARISRELHDANILCLAARDIAQGQLLDILESWLNTRPLTTTTHTLETMDIKSNLPSFSSLPPKPSLAEVDPDIAAAIKNEYARQRDGIELIASENFTSRAVMEAQGSCFTNKYAEGYPRKRWYGGCEFVDTVEDLALSRLKALFDAKFANVQAHSGSQANAAVYFSVLQPGDMILTMDLSHGGHLTHGHKMNFSGRLYRVVHYGVNKETEQIDYDEVEKLALEHRPKMITAGASAYSRIIDFERMRQIADKIGAYLFVDMAHIAGLVAAGVHPSPVPHAHFVTSTTHKTLRGPRGGIILTNDEKLAKEIDSQMFPGVQGGPLVHVIAGKAVAFGEALRPEFKTYQEQVARNAKALCEGMKKNGYRIVSGKTENHLMLVDLQPKGVTGKDVQELLDTVGITVNKNAIPFDTQSPFKAGGIRLGTPAVTTRGMKEDEMFDIANLIHEAIENRGDAAKLKLVNERVREITGRFQLPF